MTDRPLDAKGMPEGYPFQPGLEVTPRETRDAIAEAGADGGEAILLDVREHDELAVARVEGAVHIPLGELEGKLNQIEAEEDTPILVMCKLGGRSLKATLFLHQQGFKGARSVAGGIDLWARDIDPTLKRY